MRLSHGRPRILVALACVVTLFAAACAQETAAPSLLPSPSTSDHMMVTINGYLRTVPTGLPLGQTLEAIGIRPRSGRLLDVTGVPIPGQNFPPRMRVDGQPASRDTPITEDSAIVFINGRDRTEKTFEERERVDEPRPANPQYVMGIAKGEIVTEYGEVSGKVASAIFEPVGRIDSPKAVALTFDDGPHPAYTSKVLAILRRFKVPATFFVLGYLAERYPGIIRDEVEAGHAVGSHSWNHPHDFASLTHRKQSKQIGDSVAALRSLGADPYLFRPPEGSFDSGVVQLAEASGLRTVMWSADTHDYQSSATASQISRYVLSHLKPGAIVLMHDGGGDQSATVKALPDIIKGIRKRGYQIVAIPRDG